MRATHIPIAVVVAVLATLGAVAAMAVATPPSGQHPSQPVIGALAGEQKVHTEGLKFRTDGPVDVATFTVTYDPSGLSGWHTHPGMIFAVVQSGSVVRQVGCAKHTYHAGEAFIESGEQPAGQVSNPSTSEPAVLSATQITPRGSVRREEANPPNCDADGDDD